MRRALLPAATLGALFPALAGAAAMYTVTAIDRGLGFRTGVASIAENGLISGAYAADGTNNGQLFRWYQGIFEELGGFSDFIGGANSSGMLSAGDRVYNGGSNGFTTIGDLGGGFTRGAAINESGTIVGSSAQAGATEADRAFRWTEAGGIEDLGTLPGFDRFSGARGINDLGDIVGISTGFNPGTRAVLWPTTGGVVDLGPGGALDINNNGAIIGTLQAGAGGWYLENGQQTFLPNLSGLLDGFTGPRALNDHGQVVGASTDVTVNFQLFDAGFIWDETNGLQDLNDLIPEDSGWFLGTAYDINNAGQIVGSGFYEGRTVGYLLTPVPEPSALLLILTAAGTIILLRRRP